MEWLAYVATLHLEPAERSLHLKVRPRRLARVVRWRRHLYRARHMLSQLFARVRRAMEALYNEFVALRRAVAMRRGKHRRESVNRA